MFSLCRACRCDVQKSLTRRHNFQSAKLHIWKSPRIIIIRHSLTTHQQLLNDAAQHIPPPFHRLSPPKLAQLYPPPQPYTSPLINSQPRPRTLFLSSPHGDIPHSRLNPAKLCHRLRQRYRRILNRIYRPRTRGRSPLSTVQGSLESACFSRGTRTRNDTFRLGRLEDNTARCNHLQSVTPSPRPFCQGSVG